MSNEDISNSDESTSPTPSEFLATVYQESISSTLWLKACLDVLADDSQALTKAQEKELLRVTGQALEKLENDIKE